MSVMTVYINLYLGNEKDDGDYPSEDTLRILGKPYDVQHDRSSEQRDKLEQISISCDPHGRRRRSPIAMTEEHREVPAPRFQIGR